CLRRQLPRISRRQSNAHRVSPHRIAFIHYSLFTTFMNFKEAIIQSLASLNRNRTRSGLTMLGIIWGLVTVVLLLSYGRSVGQEVLRGFLGIGNNIVMFWGGQTSMQAGGER